jgi:16S rRNA (guanine527-N7)-methyltransferase
VTQDCELAAGVAELGLDLDRQQRERLLQYAAQLRRWNRAFNLVSRRDVERLVPRHLLDSLALVGLLRGTRVVDLGTGAGLPGIPLAIACPTLRFTLLDRNERRIRFVGNVVRELGLPNVDTWAQDYRRFRPSELFDTVVARAVADAPTMWKAALTLLRMDGQALLQVGPNDGAPPIVTGNVERVELNVPGLSEPRFVLRITKLPAAVGDR